MDEHRLGRVSEAVKEELSEIIGFEMSDPRLAVVDVVEVHVSPDSRHAHISVEISGDEQARTAAVAALDHAQHYLRNELARRLNLRRIPELHFVAERLCGAMSRVELLLDRAKKKRGPTENQP